MLQSPNINIVPQHQIGQAVAQGFAGLQKIQEAKILDEQEKIKRFSELADVSFTKTGLSNNAEVVAAANAYVSDLTDVAAKYKGNIPYAEQSKYQQRKRDLLLLTQKSVEAENDYKKVIMALAMDKADAYDKKKTEEALKIEKLKPLAQQDFLGALQFSFNPYEYAKKKGVFETDTVREGDSAYVSRDTSGRTRHLYDTDETFRAWADEEFAKKKPDELEKFAGAPEDAKEFAVSVLEPFHPDIESSYLTRKTPTAKTPTMLDVPFDDKGMIKELSTVSYGVHGEPDAKTGETKQVGTVSKTMASVGISTAAPVEGVPGAGGFAVYTPEEGMSPKYEDLKDRTVSGKVVGIAYVDDGKGVAKAHAVIKGKEKASSLTGTNIVGSTFVTKDTDVTYYVPLNENLKRAVKNKNAKVTNIDSLFKDYKTKSGDATSYIWKTPIPGRKKGNPLTEEEATRAKDLYEYGLIDIA